MTNEEIRDRALAAHRLLQDETFQSLVLEARRTLQDEWEKTYPEETAKRETLWHRIGAWKDVVEMLQDRIREGENLQALEEQARKRQERIDHS